MYINKNKLIKALHEYIDSLDDNGLYDFVLDNEMQGKDIFECSDCESTYGGCAYLGIGENTCKIRFINWMHDK